MVVIAAILPSTSVALAWTTSAVGVTKAVAMASRLRNSSRCISAICVEGTSRSWYALRRDSLVWAMPRSPNNPTPSNSADSRAIKSSKRVEIFSLFKVLSQ